MQEKDFKLLSTKSQKIINQMTRQYFSLQPYERNIFIRRLNKITSVNEFERKKFTISQSIENETFFSSKISKSQKASSSQLYQSQNKPQTVISDYIDRKISEKLIEYFNKQKNLKNSQNPILSKQNLISKGSKINKRKSNKQKQQKSDPIISSVIENQKEQDAENIQKFNQKQQMIRSEDILPSGENVFGQKQIFEKINIEASENSQISNISMGNTNQTTNNFYNTINDNSTAIKEDEQFQQESESEIQQQTNRNNLPNKNNQQQQDSNSDTSRQNYENNIDEQQDKIQDDSYSQEESQYLSQDNHFDDDFSD